MIQAQMAGCFKIDVIDPNGVVRETRDWQPNLFTDFGLNSQFERNTSPMIMFGSGTTEPQVTDKSMESFVHLKAPDGGRVDKYAGYQKEDEYIYDYVVFTARFLNHTEEEKTLSEIGLGFIQYWYNKEADDRLDDNYYGRRSSYSNYNSYDDEWPHVDKGTLYRNQSYETRLFTHALIKGGDATAVQPITLPAGWYLDVRYEVRRYYSLEMPTGTVQLTIDGEPKKFNYKCRMQRRNPSNDPDTTSGFSYRNTVAFMDLAYTNLLDGIGIFNSESSLGTSTYIYKYPLDGAEPWQAPDHVTGQNDGVGYEYVGNNTNRAYGWVGDYVSGSLKRTFYFYFGLPLLNKFKNESIRTILLGTSIGRWFIEYTDDEGNGIPKDETKELRLEFELGIGRYNGTVEPRE